MKHNNEFYPVTYSVKPPSTKDSKEIHENKEKTILEQDEPKRETKVYQEL